MRHRVLSTLFAAGMVAVLGCDDIDPAPTAVFFRDGGARDPEFGLTGSLDALPVERADEDGDQDGIVDGDGVVDGDDGIEVVPLCVPVNLADPTTFVEVRQAGTILEFVPRAAFARLTTNTLGEPVLLVALTEGACELGAGQQLTFEIARSAIGQDVEVGETILLPEPAPVRARFQNVRDPGVPEIFGTCSDASGALVFGSLAAEEGALVRATFPDIRLGSCAEAPGGDPVVVTGGFQLPVSQSPFF